MREVFKDERALDDQLEIAKPRALLDANHGWPETAVIRTVAIPGLVRAPRG